MNIIIIILVILCFILLIFNNIKENMSNISIPYVINSGNVIIKRPPNSDLKVNELCILNRNDNSSDLQRKCKIDTDCGEDNLLCLNKYCTRKNSASCLNESSLGILESLPHGRLSTMCIGNSCLTEEHLKVLKGEAPLNIMTGNNVEFLLTNSTLKYTPNGYIAFLNSNGDHLTNVGGSSFTWDSKIIGPKQSFILINGIYSVTISTSNNEYIYGDSEGNIVVNANPGNEQNKCILKKNNDGTFSLASSFNLYLSWKDNKVSWGSPNISKYEKFTTVDGLTLKQMTADNLYQQQRNNAINHNNHVASCSSDLSFEFWETNAERCGTREYVTPPCPGTTCGLKNYDTTKNVVVLPEVNMWSSQKSLEFNDDSQQLYITNIEDIPTPVPKPPVINSIQYNKPNPIYTNNTFNIEYNESKTPKYPDTKNNLSIE